MREIVIREVDSIRLFKLSFIIFSFFGFVLGLLSLLFAFITFPADAAFGGTNYLYIILRSSIGMMLLAILYGILLSFAILIAAKIYNSLSRRVGGITFYIEDNHIEE